jgi:hypothetical protein
VTLHNLRTTLAVLALTAVGAALAPPTAHAQPSVAPGGWIYLDTPARRGVECWIGYSTSDCDLPRWRSPGLPTEATGTLIRGNFAPDLPVGLGLDNRAIAWLEYEFQVAGSTGFVNMSIAAKYNLDAQVGGSAAYAANTLLSMTLTDISDPNEAFIASVTLWDGNRQGDQGLTDISAGAEHHVATGEVGQLETVLTRGRRYRVRIAAQGSGSMLILGDVLAKTEAVVHYLRVQAAPDVFTRLDTHDAQVQSALAAHDSGIKQVIAAHDLQVQQALAAHDAGIKAALAQHDQDIKALLRDIHATQREIIRLLLTPEGRRSTTFCDSGHCSFPIR